MILNFLDNYGQKVQKLKVRTISEIQYLDLGLNWWRNDIELP